MSQRNPMNERYSSENKRGVTRKSAASAKPKTKAAATVTIGTTKKTPAERKAAQKAARKKEQERQRELDRKYYKPDTARYKRLRLTWWLSLAGAIVCVCASWALRDVQPDWLAVVALFAAYALIIFAFYVDFSKIRKERRAYQQRMVALEEEDAKAARKAGTKASAASAAAEKEAESEKAKPVVQSRRGLGARRNKAQQAEAAKLAAEKAADETGESEKGVEDSERS